MPTENTLQRNSAFPSLLANKRNSTMVALPLLEALAEIPSGESDIISLLIDASEETGFEFLFEMPGALFHHDRIRAFVMRYEDQKQSFHSFITFDPTEGKIAIMNQDELTPQARKFFASYHGVLSCLSKISTVEKLN